MKHLPTIIITVIILAIIFWPASAVPDPGIPAFDKLVHFCLFLAWSVAILHDFNLKWYTALIAAIVFSLVTEIIQLGLKGRTFDGMDLLADMAGAVFGLANSGFIIRITKKVLRR